MRWEELHLPDTTSSSRSVASLFRRFTSFCLSGAVEIIKMMIIKVGEFLLYFGTILHEFIRVLNVKAESRHHYVISQKGWASYPAELTWSTSTCLPDAANVEGFLSENFVGKVNSSNEQIS